VTRAANSGSNAELGNIERYSHFSHSGGAQIKRAKIRGQSLAIAKRGCNDINGELAGS
jgi:hypothetical protein